MSVYPAWPAGSRITADKLLAGQTQLIQKTADESVTSNTTPQNDDELFVSVAANAVYVIDAWIFAYQGAPSTGTGSATIDLKTDWAVPAGVTGWKWCMGPATTMTSRESTTVVLALSGFGTDRSYGLNDSNNGTVIHEHLIVTTAATSGTAQFRWSQDTSNALASTVGALSHLIVQRVG